MDYDAINKLFKYIGIYVRIIIVCIIVAAFVLGWFAHR